MDPFEDPGVLETLVWRETPLRLPIETALQKVSKVPILFVLLFHSRHLSDELVQGPGTRRPSCFLTRQRQVIVIEEEFATGSYDDEGARRGASDLSNAGHLVELVLACEERSSTVELKEDAP